MVTICACLQPQFTTRKQSSRSSGDLWTRTWRPYEWFGRECGDWVIFLNTTLRAAVHLGQDHDANLHYVKNHLWNSVRQLFNENGKLIGEQKNHWCKALNISKMQRGCRQTWREEKAYRITNATVYVFSDSVLCVVKWEVVLLRPGRAKLNGIRKTITSRIWIESTECRRSSSGKYSQESWRCVSSRNSKFNERLTVWTWGLHRQDHLHVNVQRHWMESKRKQRKMWIQFTDRLVNSRAVIGLSWSLDQKRNDAESTPINQTDPGTEWQRIWWWISQDPVIQYFESPVPLREENYEAKEETRSLYTSMVVRKTSSCFSARWFLQISSVSTEQ